MEFGDFIDPYHPLADEAETLIALYDAANPGRTILSFTACFQNVFEDYVDRHLNRPVSEQERYVARFLEHAERLSSVPPTQAELDQVPVLQGWCAAALGSTPFLLGQVSGHPLLRWGARTRTSPLFQIAPDHSWARTWNRYYKLDGYKEEVLFRMQADGVVASAVELIRLDRGPLH
tara:strand:+ start:528 stop:1055 length:528 start_codon:yes stop_codon:yes gene_type:complete